MFESESGFKFSMIQFWEYDFSLKFSGQAYQKRLRTKIVVLKKKTQSKRQLTRQIRQWQTWLKLKTILKVRNLVTIQVIIQVGIQVVAHQCEERVNKSVYYFYLFLFYQENWRCQPFQKGSQESVSDSEAYEIDLDPFTLNNVDDWKWMVEARCVKG